MNIITGAGFYEMETDGGYDETLIAPRREASLPVRLAGMGAVVLGDKLLDSNIPGVQLLGVVVERAGEFAVRGGTVDSITGPVKETVFGSATLGSLMDGARSYSASAHELLSAAADRPHVYDTEGQINKGFSR